MRAALVAVSARHLDYIEVGTSDFDTLARTFAEYPEVSGLSIEPVEAYARQLPRGKRCHLAPSPSTSVAAA